MLKLFSSPQPHHPLNRIPLNPKTTTMTAPSPNKAPTAAMVTAHEKENAAAETAAVPGAGTEMPMEMKK